MAHHLLSSIKTFPARLGRLSGRKAYAAAFGFGALMALAMPPFNLFPLVFVSLPALIVLLRGTQNLRQAFAMGWYFAFGFFVPGLYWVAASMFVEFNRFWWAIPFSVVGLPALLALFYGGAAMLAKRLGPEGLSGTVTFGLMWFLADYARGHLFTGFPWLLLGHTWSGVLPVLQITSVIGIYGLTLLTAVAASLPAAPASRSNRYAQTAAVLFFLVLAAWGAMRLASTPDPLFEDVRLRLVQPNIPQADKWRADVREKNFRELLALTQAPAEEPPSHIIWPEAASPYFLAEEPARLQAIAEALPPNASLITGVLRRALDQEGRVRYYNALIAIDDKGRLAAAYDKTHLVPFGEYMPFRTILPLDAVAASDEDFSAGPKPQTLRVPGLPSFSPLICYEAIFPSAVTDAADRPAFLLNVTNDAWFGRTTGPYQHAAFARIRAIEEGMSLVRVGDTGISEIVDSLGRIRKKLGLEQKGFIDYGLPKPLPPTFFAKTQDLLVWMIFFALFLSQRNILKRITFGKEKLGLNTNSKRPNRLDKHEIKKQT
ncbi:MAG: apolipoprotein N-acyltransferase [Alphaproteobacteria bacterium]|nr:apolipoprotein N-acyltransferase [Alphaproteobacteria bacterium]